MKDNNNSNSQYKKNTKDIIVNKFYSLTWKSLLYLLKKFIKSSMYIRVLRRTTILYAGSMVFAIAICVTFILPIETKKLPYKEVFSKDITLEGVLYFLLRNLQICGPLLLAIGTLMLALGCCSKTLEHSRGNFADLYESNLNLDGTTIASDEDMEMVENFHHNQNSDDSKDYSMQIEMNRSHNRKSRETIKLFSYFLFFLLVTQIAIVNGVSQAQKVYMEQGDRQLTLIKNLKVVPVWTVYLHEVLFHVIKVSEV